MPREIQLWGTSATVRVDQPKTAAATIADVTLGTPVSGLRSCLPHDGFFEPMVTRDGRLIVGRLAKVDMVWGAPCVNVG